MVFNKNLNLGSRISINDVIFKRTSQKKANFSKEDFNNDNLILKKSVKKNQVVKKNLFRNIRIGIIIAGRLKSTRLENKALLKIAGKPRFFIVSIVA